MSKKVVYIYNQPYSNYGCSNFLLDALMLVLTCGLWFFVILFREAFRPR